MLPIGTEPLVLADGTKVNPIDGTILLAQEEDFVEVPNYADVQQELVIKRKRISELPLPPKEMNAISVIIGYTLFGVTDEDIGVILAIDEEQIQRIKLSDNYQELLDTFTKNIVDNDSDNVRNLFAQQSVLAAQKITSMIHSPSPTVAMSAARDVLDRAGHRPADVVNHKHTMEGGLTIRHIKPSSEDKLVIDITPDGDSL